MFFKIRPRCCNTCADVQDAYRRKGWALKDPDSVTQVFSNNFRIDVIYSTLWLLEIFDAIMIMKIFYVNKDDKL